MSVLIRGIEEPKSCEDCPCAYFTEGMHHNYCQALGYDSEIKSDFGWKLDDCPLVPVPPHGDLVDRDALPTGRVEWEDIIGAPTIIPASEEGE